MQLSGSDKIPVKTDTITVDINDTYLKNINNGLSNNSFFDSLKLAAVRLIFKGKEEKTEMKKSRRVHILNCLSKIYEKVTKTYLRH